jgi:hypothetical protein
MTRIRRCVTNVLCVMLGPALLIFQPMVQPPVRATAVSAAAYQGPWSIGAWSAPLDLGFGKCAIHAHLLPNGKVLFWGRDKQWNGSGWIDVVGHCQTYVWDPSSGNILASPANSTTNLFCSGHSFLPDGRLLVAGGHLSDAHGEAQTNIFDPNTNVWSNGPLMDAGRWYPTTCPLGDGETLAISGFDSSGNVNYIPQAWQTNGTWRTLASDQQENIYSYYPRMLLAPTGQVFDAGPNHITWLLSPSGSGAWTSAPFSNYTASDRDYGSAAMYDDGKVIIVGGGTPPTATAEVINLSMNNPVQNQNPAWRYVGSMAKPRRQMNLTILADGKLLATGGTTSGGCLPSGLKTAELWDPATEAWSTMASMADERLYHSTALLLPDGTVLSGGSGGNGPTTDPNLDDTRLEIYSPPYLFNGARPTITSPSMTVNNGQQFFVQTPDAATIAKVTLIRLSSVTHSFNQDQRINFLSFRQAPGGLNVTAPGSGNLCPPGYYMLFIVNGNGVPSVACMVQVTIPSSPSNAIDDQRFFTRQQFYDILLREADAGGLAFWTNQITQCGNDPNCIANQRTAVSRAFWDSTEFQARVSGASDSPFLNPPPGLEFNASNFVTWCYRIYLARQPDPGGQQYWTNSLNNCIAANPGNASQCYNNLISAFTTSAEYRNRFYKP